MPLQKDTEPKTVAWDWHETGAEHLLNLLFGKRSIIDAMCHYPKRYIGIDEWERIQEIKRTEGIKGLSKLFVVGTFDPKELREILREKDAERRPFVRKVRNNLDIARHMFLNRELWMNPKNREFILPYWPILDAANAMRDTQQAGLQNVILSGVPGECLDPLMDVLKVTGILPYLNPNCAVLLKNTNIEPGFWPADKIETIPSKIAGVELLKLLDGAAPVIVDDVRGVGQLANFLTGAIAVNPLPETVSTRRQKRANLVLDIESWRKYSMNSSHDPVVNHVPLAEIAGRLLEGRLSR